MENKKKSILKTLTLVKIINKFCIIFLCISLSSCSSTNLSKSVLSQNALSRSVSNLKRKITGSIIGKKGRTPANYGFNYSEVKINSKISSWFILASNQNNLKGTGISKGTVIFLHSKSGNIKTDFYQTLWLLNKGYNVLIPDFEDLEIKEIYSELDSVVNFVGKNEKLGKIILWGQDTGASMAIYLAANSFNKNDICLTIAEGTIPNYRKSAQKGFKKSFMLRPLSKMLAKFSDNTLDAEQYVENVAPVPLLLIHGSKDKQVLPKEAEALFSKARKPKKLWLVKNANHLNSLYNQRDRQNELGQYLDSNCLK